MADADRSQLADATGPGWSVPPLIQKSAAYSWRLLVIGAAVFVVAWVVSQLRLVLLPLFVAVLLTACLVPPARWLTRRGLPRWLATWLTFLSFLGLLALVFTLIVPPMTDEFADLKPTVEQGIDEVEDWLVTGPLDLDRQQVKEARQDVADAVSSAATSRGALVSGTVLVAEIVAGLVLALVLAFFLVKDAEMFQQWALDRLPEDRRPVARRVGTAAWWTLGGFLRGAAMLGAVEAVIIGITLAAVGSAAALPVAVLTFFAAFVPFIGAIVAGVIAVLVALVSGGLTDALIVGVVALAVQQLDNDVLAPFVYGRAVRIHPVVVILAVTTGAALTGFIGAFLAVPFVAIAINATLAAKGHPDAPGVTRPDPA